MNKIFKVSIIIFLFGFFLKFFHTHYNAIIMMVALFLMLIVNIVSCFKTKQEKVNNLIGFATTFWLTALLFIVKFWPFPVIIMSFALLLTLVALYLSFKENNWKQYRLILLSACLSITFFVMPTDTRYYLISIKWNYKVESDYFSWDKYSWFLYKNNKQEESLKASNRALDIVKQTNESEWIKVITNHNTRIKDKNWQKFNSN